MLPVLEPQVSTSKLQVMIPDDIFLKRRIDKVAKLVALNGSIIERVRKPII